MVLEFKIRLRSACHSETVHHLEPTRTATLLLNFNGETRSRANAGKKTSAWQGLLPPGLPRVGATSGSYLA